MRVGLVFPEHRDPDEHLLRIQLLSLFYRILSLLLQQHRRITIMDAIIESGRKIWEGEIVRAWILRADEGGPKLTAPRTLKVNAWSRCSAASC